MSRDVTLTGTMAELVGDETYEVWLKHGTGSWSLVETGVVAVDDDSQQDFVVEDLTEGDTYTAQVRLKRAGRYRVGYLTTNPDTWPAQSRCVFVPGSLIGVGAPTIVSGEWTRDDVDSTHIDIVITPDDPAVDLALYRDGVRVGTASAPHVGDVTITDTDPPVGVNHNYIAYHIESFLTGPASNDLDVFAGIAPLSGLVQSSSTSAFYLYDLAWDSEDEAIVRVQDDYLSENDFASQGTVAPTSTGVELHIQKNSAHESNGNVPCTFTARARRELDGDVSAWVTVDIECAIASDETAYGTR